ncbi:MarR family transcriptional regulator [Fictibacillus sp. Mic-4]|uniref:MarR family winged helix-turn-helix transcriptional regulator n=1 Tax=Fictibacillus TaxID=1329200 RepID=UPI0004299E80|nr:MarR family transcriptional regulator [Fictibacillus gelatini]
MKMDESLGFLIGLTYRKMIQLLFMRLKEFDITPEQWSILLRLSREDGINQKEISIRAAKDQPTTTRILDCLHKKELIEKRTSEKDRRAFLIYLTDKGRNLIEETIPVEKKAIEDMTSGIEQQELDFFKGILLQINQNVASYLKD